MAGNTVYENFVLESKATDLLTTSVNTRSLMNIDTTLAANAGMIKTINVYTYTGAAEVVAEGDGNTTRGSVAYVPISYEVKMLQQAFDYLDEDIMKDPSIVDVGMKGAAQVMANKLTADFYAALETEDEDDNLLIKTSDFETTIGYDAVVDAIAEMNVEDESQLFLIIAPEWKADIRKDEDYKAAQAGEVIYNGQVGTVAGIPVISSKALDGKACAYLMTKDAVSCFLKKDVEIEQERDADKRKNSVYMRTAYLVALADATKACKITNAASGGAST